VRRVLLRPDEGPQDEGSRVTGVEVQDRRTGRVSAIEAPVVVVAADALRTPQLLHASGVRPRALGRYLNDQPQVITAVQLRADLLERSPAPDSAAATAGGVARQSGVSWVPFDDERHPFHGQVMQMDASPVPLAPGATQVPGSFVGLGWFCAKDVREQDRVTFDDDASDPYGMPQPVVHYTLSAVDHARRQAATAALRTAAAALGTALGEPIPLAPGSSLHYQGTTRMGRVDDGTSVCDTESRVWGVPGLHVAGNGLIATEMACNPTLTSVALAVRGARGVAERWGGVPAGATHHARPEQPA
jgi:pyranose oxidase